MSELTYNKALTIAEIARPTARATNNPSVGYNAGGFGVYPLDKGDLAYKLSELGPAVSAIGQIQVTSTTVRFGIILDTNKIDDFARYLWIPELYLEAQLVATTTANRNIYFSICTPNSDYQANPQTSIFLSNYAILTSISKSFSSTIVRGRATNVLVDIKSKQVIDSDSITLS